jgi:hypothetical protein
MQKLRRKQESEAMIIIFDIMGGEERIHFLQLGRVVDIKRHHEKVGGSGKAAAGGSVAGMAGSM